MSKLLTWSTTALNNNSTPPDGFPEGQAPSSLNNSGREVMAASAYFADILGLPFINLGFTATVASNDLTIALKTAAAADPATTDPVTVYFRNTTVTTGQRVAVDYSTATSVVLPGGGSMGYANSETGYIHVYAVYDGTNKDIGISRLLQDESVLHSTTTIGTGSDAVNVVYTTTGRTSAAITLIGRIRIQYGTAAWTNAPTNLLVWQQGMSREIKDSYTGTTTAIDGAPTITVNFSIMGDVVTLTTGASVTGTSNANTFTITGAPALITPSALAGIGFCLLTDNGTATDECQMRMGTDGTLGFLMNASFTGFTASGTKGIGTSKVCYTYKLTNP